MRHSVFVTFEFDNLSMSALVSVLPELVAESDPKEALKQVALPSSTCLCLQILVEKEKLLFHKADCVNTLFKRWAASSLVLPSWVGSPSSEQEQTSIWKQVVGKCEDKLLSMIFCKTSCELKPVPTLTVIIVLMTLLNKLVGKGRKELKYHEYLNFHFETAFLQCVSSNALLAGACEVALVALLWFLLSGEPINMQCGEI